MTPELRAQTESYLADARKAYHRISTGAQPRVVVDQNGERVEYSVANLAQLQKYISELEAALACRSAGIPPIRVWF